MIDNISQVNQSCSVAQDAGAFTAQNNAEALSTLLELMESASLTNRDKGDRFERLVLDYFRYDKKFAGVFTKVQPYAEWAAEHPELTPNKNDTGVDLVATNNHSFNPDLFGIVSIKKGGVAPYQQKG